MLDDQEVETIVDSIPGSEGWWTTSGRDTYIETAKLLANTLNVDPDDVINILNKLYWATAEQFGG